MIPPAQGCPWVFRDRSIFRLARVLKMMSGHDVESRDLKMMSGYDVESIVG